MNGTPLSTTLAVLLAASSTTVAAADPNAAGTAPTSVETLEQKVETMSKQLEELKAQLKELKAQTAAPTSAPAQPPTQAQQPAEAKVQQPAEAKPQQATEAKAQQPVEAKPQQAKAEPSMPLPPEQPAPAERSLWDRLSVWGYGEVYYMRPTTEPSQTIADLARAVIGFGYQFSPTTRFNSEFEWEHAVTSSEDVGEVEVEQFYVDHNLNDWASVQAGLFLIPAGLLNEHHEPTQFYGVQRNFVETLIIPSTWREGGLAFKAVMPSGFTGQVGLTTGLDFSKWNFTPATPLYTNAFELEFNNVAPMQATHQELAIANAQHLSGFASLNYTGVLGLLVGGSIFSGGVVPALPNLPDNERATLWELHTRWTPGKFDLSAVYAHGYFINTAEANIQFPGASNPLPASFYGYYLQAAYQLWEKGEMRLNPFVRWERYNMASTYAGVTWAVPPAGFPQPYDNVATVGLNYYLTPGVVFKADYQHFAVNETFTRFDLGVGLSF